MNQFTYYRFCVSFLAVAALVICTSCGSETSATSQPEPVGALHALILGPGPAWDTSLSLEELAAGPLANHTEEIERRFEKGQLLANAFRADGLGLYLYDREAVVPQSLVDSDPGIQSGVLSVVSHERWTLLIENMGLALDSQQTFVLEYELGASAVAGMPLLQQDIGSHSAYYGGLFQEGRVLAGGVIAFISDTTGELVTEPIVGEETRARYIVLAEDQSAADAIVAADPAVIDRTLSGSATLWANPNPPFPTHFHLRSLEDTKAAR